MTEPISPATRALLDQTRAHIAEVRRRTTEAPLPFMPDRKPSEPAPADLPRLESELVAALRNLAAALLAVEAALDRLTEAQRPQEPQEPQEPTEDA